MLTYTLDIMDIQGLHIQPSSISSRLSDARRKRMLQYHHDTDQLVCAYAELLLTATLQKWGYPNAVIDWHGKPSCPNIPVHFNISHSQTRIAVLCGTMPCGVDIENIRSITKEEQMTKRLFSDEERANIHDTHDFLRYWTAKEAFIKFTGEGFSRSMSRIHIDPLQNIAVSDTIQAHLQWFEWGDTTIGCICTHAPAAVIRQLHDAKYL